MQKKKIIVLMSDGEPNEGKTGDELIEFAETIKNEGIYIYTLGFLVIHTIKPHHRHC